MPKIHIGMDMPFGVRMEAGSFFLRDAPVIRPFQCTSSFPTEMERRSCCCRTVPASKTHRKIGMGITFSSDACLPLSRFVPLQAQVSPNGRYLAYVTAESGTNQVVVQTFPDPTKGKWQITASGGIEPRWRGDGRELFYLEPDGKLNAVSVKTESVFEVGDRAFLFQIPFATGLPGFVQRYDVTADGQRFLVVPPTTGSGETSPATITAVVNWPALLRRK